MSATKSVEVGLWKAKACGALKRALAPIPLAKEAVPVRPARVVTLHTPIRDGAEEGEGVAVALLLAPGLTAGVTEGLAEGAKGHCSWRSRCADESTR